jgi:hypothetical protein
VALFRKEEDMSRMRRLMRKHKKSLGKSRLSYHGVLPHITIDTATLYNELV